MVARLYDAKRRGTCDCGTQIAVGQPVLIENSAVVGCGACSQDKIDAVAKPEIYHIRLTQIKTIKPGEDGTWAVVQGALLKTISEHSSWPQDARSAKPLVWTVVGVFPTAPIRDSVWFARGNFEITKHGSQFKATTLECVIDHDNLALQCYLCTLPEIGHVRAEAIIKRFGPKVEDIIDVLTNRSQELTQIPGLTPERVEGINDTVKMTIQKIQDLPALIDLGLNHWEVNDAYILYFRCNHGIKSLFEWVKSNPYRLVEALGWERADQLALIRLNFDPKDVRRLAAGINLALSNCALEGDTAIPVYLFGVQPEELGPNSLNFKFKPPIIEEESFPKPKLKTQVDEDRLTQLDFREQTDVWMLKI